MFSFPVNRKLRLSETFPSISEEKFKFAIFERLKYSNVLKIWKAVEKWRMLIELEDKTEKNVM